MDNSEQLPEIRVIQISPQKHYSMQLDKNEHYLHTLYSRIYRSQSYENGKPNKRSMVQIIRGHHFEARSHWSPSVTLEEFNSSFKIQCELWKSISHSNILQLYDYVHEKDHWYLFMQDHDGSGLVSHRVPEIQALTWCKGIASALAYLHSKDMSYWSLKPSKIVIIDGVPLLRPDPFIKRLLEYEPVNTVKSAPTDSFKYKSPALLIEDSSSRNKDDVWALGWILFELVYGFDPWPAEQARFGVHRHDPIQCHLFEIIETNELRLPHKGGISEKTRDLISKMLEVDQDVRIDAQSLFDLL